MTEEDGSSGSFFLGTGCCKCGRVKRHPNRLVQYLGRCPDCLHKMPCPNCIVATTANTEPSLNGQPLRVKLTPDCNG